MASGSSARKVAKLAQKRSGRNVRFRGGSLFPITVAVVALVGLLLIVYGRVSRPEADASPPQVNDHWHASFGIYVCDKFLPDIAGTAEGNGELGDESLFRVTGVHSHNDGVIHWHPYSTRAVGRRAQLGVFLDVYGYELSDDRLVIPQEQGGYVPSDGGEELHTIEEGETTCNGEDAQLSVVVWPSYASTGDQRSSVTQMDDARIDNDMMAITIAFVPNDTTDIPQPPSTPRLPELASSDSGQVAASTTTVPAAGGSTLPGETSSTVAGDGTTTVPDDTSSTTVGSATTTVEATTTSTPG